MRGPVTSVLTSLINEEIKYLNRWAERNNLKFSASKTVAMMITNKRRIVEQPVKIGDKDITWVKEFKYLGVIIDNKLKFQSHI